MDVETLRRSREMHVDEMNKTISEMNEFIGMNLNEIRDALTVCVAESKYVDIDELRAFVEHRINQYIVLINEKKRDSIKYLVHGKINKDAVDAIIITEYCYTMLIHREESDDRRISLEINNEKNAQQEKLNVFVNIITGTITIRFTNGHETVVNNGSIDCEYNSLRDLFSSDFQLSINKNQMNVDLLNMKLKMGIEAFKIAVESPEDCLYKLISYKTCKDHGVPVIVSNEDTIDIADDDLEHLHYRVQQQIADVISMQIADVSKAYLINYLLVMLIGLSGKVDLSYFINKKEMYMLYWAMPTALNK
ncbi:hypothetical protein CWI42_050540 [Ordospora colligata]|uniref:Uncharacterized protein n=1 Tax=Ordospora colligata OC4 TaxID=1354746 RepID=A0A0B2UKY6_9MICR|nr:uncharacterized protein M896_050570 [Ordospora colligata OC4]KHN69650.1 hypothetical protein M896_050570 [Ordospora colligata OC4]TBU15769.1 hypothetical protein CWI41_050560 [Ordospora colligata]TBU15897.1 hypothetical protein CWI40_050580 [Ordospora colligata]TBU18791.1 hypothetical protein CWI42_050540 [Ordospora colligata]